VACGKGGTQTSPVPTHDQATYVLMVPPPVLVADAATQVVTRPHQTTSSTQTPSSAPTSDQGTQVTIRPPRSVAYTQTATAPNSTRSSCTQVPRTATTNTGTDMSWVLVISTSCQAGEYFDNEVIPPGAPRPKLPWAYTYAQYDALLAAYPDVHPEDFMTCGILQAQPGRGSRLGLQ